MKKLIVIKDKDIGAIEKKIAYHMRYSARGIVRHKRQIALLHVQKFDYYKLPGGGMESTETPEQGFLREVKEEVGAEVKIVKKIGETEEFRSHTKTHQISYCLVADVIKMGAPSFEADEIADGFKVVWMPIEEALPLFKIAPKSYEGRFIVKRDLRVLEEYMKK